eukprot:297891-Rhodomonas_salina.1
MGTSTFLSWTAFVRYSSFLGRSCNQVAVKVRIHSCRNAFQAWVHGFWRARWFRRTEEQQVQGLKLRLMMYVLREWNGSRNDGHGEREKKVHTFGRMFPSSEERRGNWRCQTSLGQRVRRIEPEAAYEGWCTACLGSMFWEWRRWIRLVIRCRRQRSARSRSAMREVLAVMQEHGQEQKKEDRNIRVLAVAEHRTRLKQLSDTIGCWAFWAVMPRTMARQVASRLKAVAKAFAVTQWRVWMANSTGRHRDFELADRACSIQISATARLDRRRAQCLALVAFRTNWRRSKRVEMRESYFMHVCTDRRLRAFFGGWLHVGRDRRDCTRCVALKLSENVSLVRVTAERKAFGRQLQTDLVKALELREETDEVRVMAIDAASAEGITASVNISRLPIRTDHDSNEDENGLAGRQLHAREEDARSVDDLVREVMAMVVDPASKLRASPSTMFVTGATASGL